MSGGSSEISGSSSSDSGAPRKRIKLRPRDVLFLLAVAAGAAFLSAPTWFVPWAHFTGGSFHVMPWWSGAGSFMGPDGEYWIYLSLAPLNEGSHTAYHTPLEGDGHLCTPSGERLIIHVEGDMDRHLPVNTVGKWIEISSFTRNKPSNFGPMKMPGSPYVRLKGNWEVGKIEAAGTLEHEAADPGQPAPPKPAPITVTLEHASDWWAPSCKGRK